MRLARQQSSFTKKVEVEVEDSGSMLKAAELGVDIIMFDNMEPSEIKKAIVLLKNKGLRDRLMLEASGDITRENLEDYADSGIDVISMGSLTRNARWIDFSLEIK